MIVSLNSKILVQVHPDADIMPPSSAPLAGSLLQSTDRAYNAEDQVIAHYIAMHKAQLEYLSQRALLAPAPFFVLSAGSWSLRADWHAERCKAVWLYLDLHANWFLQLMSHPAFC